MVVVYPLKLEDEIMPVIELKSKEEHTNKSIVLKQLIYKSLSDYVVKLCGRGRLSVGKAAEILNVSIYDIHDIARTKGIKLTASEEQVQKSAKTVKKILKQSKEEIKKGVNIIKKQR
ncbi:hypothetical protein CL618_00010 [archaeon]|nr:hypothetical protein [archaeon]|tara:strand:+ start:1677 stop:2027 length:351 start_codon:yes stop_codon:yes gene_type:complete